LDLVDAEIGGREIWQMDLARGVVSRLTLGSAEETSPVWSADGTRMAFAAKEPNGVWDLFERPASGGGEKLPLLKSDVFKFPTDWSHDGRFLIYESITRKTGRDVWILRTSGDRAASPLLQTLFNESQARFSPDGRFFAYVSDESGRTEVYVQTFPLSTGKWQVSAEGGSQPRWRSDGKEMFYLAPDGNVLAVSVSTGSSFEAGTPRALFRIDVLGARVVLGPRSQYAVTPDGQRFLIQSTTETASNAPITVVLDWTADLKK
jgi:Tol biopolymer transport system component